MHAVICRYGATSGDVDLTFARVEKSLLPRIVGLPGFVSYRVGLTEKREPLTMMTFESKAATEAAARAAVAWAAKSPSHFPFQELERIDGQVLIRTVDPQQSWHRGVIRKYMVDRRKVAEVPNLVEEDFVPILTRLRGFGLYMLLDLGEGTLLSVSGFRDKAAADASTLAAEWWKQGDVGALIPGRLDVLDFDLRVSSMR